MRKRILLALVSAALVGAALFQVIPALADTPNPLDHVLISPTSTTLPVGGVQQFGAQAFDSNNQTVADVTYLWLVTAGGGTINPTGTIGLFVVGAIPGTYTNTVEVLAVQGNLVKTATASITVSGTPGALDHVTITPASVTLTPGGTQQFTVQAYDANGVAITGLNYVWSVAPAAGTISNVLNNAITFAAGTTTGTFANAIQASTAAPAVLKTNWATITIAAATGVNQPSATLSPKIDANRLIKVFSTYLNTIGFDNFLGGQWQVKNGAGVDTVKVVPGVVQAIPSTTSPILIVLPNGQAAAVPFTISSNALIQPKGAVLAVNEKVVVVTVNDVVSVIAVIAPVTLTQMPPGFKRQGEDNRGGKQTPPGWSHGKKTGWSKSPNTSNGQSENDN